jgi:hypothetical protein
MLSEFADSDLNGVADWMGFDVARALRRYAWQCSDAWRERVPLHVAIWSIVADFLEARGLLRPEDADGRDDGEDG